MSQLPGTKDTLVGTAEAAEILGVTTSHVSQMAREGRLAVVQEWPQFRLFRRSDVLAFAGKRAERAQRDKRVTAPALTP